MMVHGICSILHFIRYVIVQLGFLVQEENTLLLKIYKILI